MSEAEQGRYIILGSIGSIDVGQFPLSA